MKVALSSILIVKSLLKIRYYVIIFYVCFVFFEKAIILLQCLQNVSPQGNEGFIIQTRFRRLMRKERPLPPTL